VNAGGRVNFGKSIGRIEKEGLGLGRRNRWLSEKQARLKPLFSDLFAGRKGSGFSGFQFSQIRML